MHLSDEYTFIEIAHMYKTRFSFLKQYTFSISTHTYNRRMGEV